MRTVEALPAELTARSRILRSALKCFAERGYDNATVRDIAAGAGVSPALVTHHFGGKAVLRAECDAQVERFLVDKQDGARNPGRVLADAVETYGPYLARMLEGPSDSASTLFARLIRVAREAVAEGVAGGRMHRSADPEAQAVVLVLLGMAPFMLGARLDEWAGAGDAISRLRVPLAEIYTRGLFVHDDVAVEASRAGDGDSEIGARS